MERARIEDVENVRAMIAAGDDAGIDAFLDPLHTADVADILQELEPGQQVALLKRLDKERAAEVLTEVDQHSGQSLLFLLSDSEVVSLLGEMSSDDAVDVMSSMPAEKTERVGALLSAEDRVQIAELMKFDEETAGGLMAVERVVVRDDATFADAIEAVRAGADDIENLQKIFVVNANGQLVGSLPVLDLIVHSPDTRVRDAMDAAVSVPVDMDQEHVAALFRKYDEFTLPVVDGDGRLLGRITVDDIIDVIEEEASEDIAHIAGTSEEEIGETSALRISRQRIPWLVAGLVGEMLNAVLMSRYELTLHQLVALAFFVPLLVGTAGNIGIQASVVVVRELALGHIDLNELGTRVGRELLVALLNGSILGAILFGGVVLWRHDVALGTLLWASLMSVMLVAALVGVSVPLLLNRWNIDPAIATGPFITVSNDILALAIYMSMATLWLSHWM